MLQYTESVTEQSKQFKTSSSSSMCMNSKSATTQSHLFFLCDNLISTTKINKLALLTLFFTEKTNNNRLQTQFHRHHHHYMLERTQNTQPLQAGTTSKICTYRRSKVQFMQMSETLSLTLRIMITLKNTNINARNSLKNIQAKPFIRSPVNH